MRRLDYDTREGIEGNLATLESFHKLLDARRKAVAISEERLNYFVVLGKFRLDEFGQLMHQISPLPQEVMRGLPPVISEGLYTSALRDWIKKSGADQYSFGWGIGGNRRLAPAHTPCAMCKQLWTIANCDDCVADNEDMIYPLRDFVGQRVEKVYDEWASRTDALYGSHSPAIRNDRFIDLRPSEGSQKDLPRNQNGWVSLKDLGGNDYVVKPGDEIDVRRTRYYHMACQKNMVAALTESAFMRMFEDAGFLSVTLWGIPNQYGSEDYRGPWYEVITNLGTFKIGWRKRVIDINWSATGKDFVHLFGDLKTTIGPGHIHAWSYVQGTKVLRRICKKLAHDKQGHMPSLT